MKQLSRQLDPVTKRKIVKSIALGVTGIISALFADLLPVLQDVLAQNPALYALIAGGVPVIVNAVKEYFQGE